MGPRILLQKGAFEEAAFRLGCTNRSLELAKTSIEEKKTLHPQTEAILRLSKNWKYFAYDVLIKAAQPLHEKLVNKISDDEEIPQPSVLTGAGAAALLQEQIVGESNRNFRSRKPDFSEIWAFAAQIPDKDVKKFFSVDRWPPWIQSPEQYKDIKRSGPPRKPIAATKKKDRPKVEKPEERQRRNSNEMYIHGETAFPNFGKPPFQQAVQSSELKKRRTYPSSSNSPQRVK